MDPQELLRVLGLGAASGTRGALALLGLALASHLGGVPLAGAWAWLGTPAAMGALAAVALVEAALERDDDLQELAGMALAGVRAASGGLAAAVGAQGWPPWAAAALGVFVALLTGGLRQRVHAPLLLARTELADPRRWVARLENGGALGVSFAAVLAPALAVAAVIVAALAAGAVAIAARRAERMRRRPCPHCGAAIRVEASGCPRCGRDVPVERSLELRLGGALTLARPRRA